MFLRLRRKEGDQFFNLDHVSIIQHEPLFDREGKVGVKLIYPETETTICVEVEEFARFIASLARKPA